MLEEEALRNGCTVTGRQVLHLIYQQFALSTVNIAAFNMKDLLGLKLSHPDNLRAYLIAWDGVIANAGDIANEDLRTALFLEQLELVPGLSEDLSHYKRMPHDDTNKSYRWLRERADYLLTSRNEEQVRQGKLNALNGIRKLQPLPLTKRLPRQQRRSRRQQQKQQLQQPCQHSQPLWL